MSSHEYWDYIFNVLITIVCIAAFLWYHVHMITEGIPEMRAWLHHSDRHVLTFVSLYIPIYAFALFFWTLHLILMLIAFHHIVNLIKGNK